MVSIVEHARRSRKDYIATGDLLAERDARDYATEMTATMLRNAQPGILVAS